MDAFPGYSPDALSLLSDVGRADRDWFSAHRDQYVACLLEPSRLLVTALGRELHDAVPDLHAVPKVNGSIAPIANDRRFRALPAYRDHLMLRFWTGADREVAPTMFVRIAETEVAFGVAMAFDAGIRDTYRDAVAGEAGADLAGVLTVLHRRHGAALLGPAAKRVPPPFPPDHPRAALLRQQRFQLRWSEPAPKTIGSSRFVPWCARRLLDLAGVDAWLHDAVLAPDGAATI